MNTNTLYDINIETEEQNSMSGYGREDYVLEVNRVYFDKEGNRIQDKLETTNDDVYYNGLI